MKTLYIECNMGAAGDMLMAALLELDSDPDNFLEQMNALGIPGVQVGRLSESKCGVLGTRMDIRIHGAEEGGHEHHHHLFHHHGHSHNGLGDIVDIIKGLPVSEKVKEDAAKVYRLIADAESKAHGKPVNEVHFHEVGAMDAVADVVGVCLLMERIGADKVIASPICTGSGFVKSAHGILPVPAPATAHLLQGIPTYAGNIKSELCTPTGAALLKHFANEFSAKPVMRIDAIGYGMGKKDFQAANCVRAFIGEEMKADTPKAQPVTSAGVNNQIAELRCNLDDMTGEALGYAQEILLQRGALDVFTQPIYMKKNRPGVLFSCICREEDSEKMARLMLQHTTTLGVRKTLCDRYILDKEMITVDTPYGQIPVKKSTGYGVTKIKAEYDALSGIAEREGKPVLEIQNEIEKLIR